MSRKTKELYKCPHCHQKMTLGKLKEHKISCPVTEAKKNRMRFAKKRPIVDRTKKKKNRTSARPDVPKKKKTPTRRFTSKIH